MAIGKGSGGGGYGSKPHVQVPQKLGRGASRVVPGGVAQYGQRVGNHFNSAEGGGGHSEYGGIDPFSGGTLRGLGTQQLGNEWAVKAGARQGPGKSATAVYKSGQQQPGPVREMQQGPEIFPGFSGGRK
jgi:hypothetical protein